MNSPLRIPEPRGKAFRLCISAVIFALGTLLIYEMAVSHPSSVREFWANAFYGAIAALLVYLSIAETRYAIGREGPGKKNSPD